MREHLAIGRQSKKDSSLRDLLHHSFLFFFFLVQIVLLDLWSKKIKKVKTWEFSLEFFLDALVRVVREYSAVFRCIAFYYIILMRDSK